MQHPAGGRPPQALDGQLTVDVGDDDASVLGGDAAINHQFVSIGDAGIAHGPAVDFHDEGVARVAHQMLAEINQILWVVVA